MSEWNSVNFAAQGWQCPICRRVYSPTTSMCYYCGNGVPYTYSSTTFGNAVDAYKTADDTLLKEPEAVAPTPPTDESDLWRCGSCNHQLFRCTHQRYCEMCGRKVKWDG